jgi:hypothetical protein
MTRAEFDSRYRLGERIAEGGVLSYRAQDLAGGREVTIHLLTGTSAPEVEHLRGLLLRLESPDRALVLAETEVEAIPVVVTEALPGFTTLGAWLEARVPGAAPEADRSMPGEFTRVFGSLPPETVGGAPPPPSSVPFPPKPASPSGSEVGSMFGPGDQAPPPRPIIRLRVSSPPAPPASAPPFQIPDLSRRGDEQPLFPNDLASTGPRRPWSATPLDNPAAAPPGTSSPARGPADIAELIAAAGGAGPMARGQPEREAQRDPSSAPPEPPSAQRSLLPLVMVLTVLLLCAVGLVVYFAVTAG